MKNFAYDIQLGFLVFPLVALLLALPYAIYQYRRFQAISLWKTFVVFTFILYCLCAVSLIVFPLPADRTAVVQIAQTPQLHPFHVLEQIREQTDFSLLDRSTWGPTLRSQVVYEAIFNVMLTIPLGAYLCYLFRCRWWMALLIGFATTLLFETSQLTSLFGIYDHPYRLFDVDDLILNTTGTMIGFWLMIPIAKALPSMNEVNERSIEKGTNRISVTRRALALLIDLAILTLMFGLVWLVLSPADAQIAKALAIDPSKAGAKSFAFRFIFGLVADPISATIIALAIGAVLFAIIPTVSKGRTIGKALTGLRIIDSRGGAASPASYWIRYGASALFCLSPLIVVVLAPEEIEGISNKTLFQMVGLVVVVWALTIIARTAASFAGRPYVSLSDIVSNTKIVPSQQNIERIADAEGYLAGADGANTRRISEQRSESPRQPDQTRRASERNAPQQSSRPSSSMTNRPSEQSPIDDHGKQAALESLNSVNYYERHPMGELPTDVLQAEESADSMPTQLITDPETKRKIKREHRPDAGGTQVFKRR